MFAELEVLEQLAGGFVKYGNGPLVEEGGIVCAASGGAR